jgi:hypothetical protein
MSSKRKILKKEAFVVGNRLGISWAEIDLEQFRQGLEIELEHGAHDSQTNITDDNLLLTGKIAWAHLNEIPDYYTRLHRMEEEAKQQP